MPFWRGPAGENLAASFFATTKDAAQDRTVVNRVRRNAQERRLGLVGPVFPHGSSFCEAHLRDGENLRVKRPQMLAACVQTDSKNEKRARKRYLGVSTLVPLKRKSAIKYHGDVHFLTTVVGGLSLLLLLALQTEGYGAGWSFCGRLLITFAPRALGRMCFQSAMPRGETDTPRTGLWEERRQAT